MGLIRNNIKSNPRLYTPTIILFLILVAATGLTFYGHQHKPSVKDSTSVGDNSQSSTPSTLANNNQIDQSATAFIDIKEWGVKASYSGTPALTYTLSTDGKAVVFSSSQLTAANSSCTGRGGAIIRWASTDKVTALPADSNAPTATQYFASASPSKYAHIGDYYYTFEHDPAACSDPSSTNQAYSQTNNAVQSLVQSLQPDSTATSL